MKGITTLILLTICLSGLHAQKYGAEAALPVVNEEGFYRITLTPELAPYVNSALSNIRIIDSKEKEVPFLLRQEQRTYHTTVFRNYNIVSKEQVKKCCTSIILENPQGTAINNISLSIRNAEVKKTASLSGSDDKSSWYALKEKFIIESISDNQNTSTVRIVDFPLSNYTYYKVEISDSTNAPLNVLGAGYYEVLSEDGKYTEVSNRLTMLDSTDIKASFITFSFDSIRILDKISLALKGAPYFLRSASILQKKEITRKQRKEIVYQPLMSFTISSKQPSIVELPGIRTDQLVIRIENQDNPPLEVSSLKTFQLNRYLTAWLKANENHSLKFGPSSMTAPSYDIGNFQESISSNISLLAPGRVVKYESATTAQRSAFFTSNVVIWVAIIAVMIILGFMAVRMVKETNAR